MKSANKISRLRKFASILLASAALTLSPPTASAQLGPQDPAKFQAAFNEAKTAYAKGDLEDAVIKLGLALEQHPHHRPSRAMLADAQRKLNADPGKQMRERLEQITIKEISFSEAELSVALAFLKKTAAEVSNGEVRPNFIMHGFGKEEPKISLDLRNVPFTDALRYVTQLSQGRIAYEKHAIVIRPAGALK